MQPKSLHSTTRLLLTSLIFLGCSVTVAALPELEPRQQCDAVVCPDWSWFSTVGETAQDTWQSISGYLGGLLLKDPPEEQLPTIPTEPLLPGSGRSIDPQNPWEPESAPETELFPGTENCPVGAPDTNDDSNGQSQLRQCSVAPAQIVVPTDCTSPKNALVAQKLAEMDPLFKTSRSARCPGENGVVFWLAYITPDQAAIILAETDGAVKGIAPDSPFKSGPLTPSPELMTSSMFVPRNTKMENRLKKKRGILKVQVPKAGNPYDPSLAFLSIPPGRAFDHNKKYVYFKTAVESAMKTNIRVYLVDTGYDPSSNQIRTDGLRWIFAMGVNRKKNDQDPDKHGTCMASKIGSPQYGAFPGGPVFTIVKMSNTISSFVDSLGLLLADVLAKKSSVEGRAVIQISGQWQPTSSLFEEVVLKSIAILLYYKVMVVSPSPSVYTGDDTLPAYLAGSISMITVGAVSPVNLPNIPYGARYPWCIAGYMTVSGPGGGFCKTGKGKAELVTGAALAAAATTGLVAYFLAIPDLQEYFLAQPDWALAVKDYVVAMSYPRHQLISSIWNGLDSEEVKTIYNAPGDPWIGIPHTGNPRFQ